MQGLGTAASGVFQSSKNHPRTGGPIPANTIQSKDMWSAVITRNQLRLAFQVSKPLTEIGAKLLGPQQDTLPLCHRA